MEKKTIQLAPDLRPDRQRSRLLPMISMLMLLLLLSPLILETGYFCYGQWREIVGSPVTVRTPILDSLCEKLQDVREEISSKTTSYFDQLSWRGEIVLPLLAVAMVIAMGMLRR